MYIYIYLEPVCPLFWWLFVPQNKVQTPIKTRGPIWVPGAYADQKMYRNTNPQKYVDVFFSTHLQVYQKLDLIPEFHERKPKKTILPKDHWTIQNWRHFEDLNTPASYRFVHPSIGGSKNHFFHSCPRLQWRKSPSRCSPTRHQMQGHDPGRFEFTIGNLRAYPPWHATLDQEIRP